MDLIQENGQPRYGRFSELPVSINIDQYIYKTPFGKIREGWHKSLKRGFKSQVRHICS